MTATFGESSTLGVAPRRRIAIIGGGIAGCAAAHRLRERGYASVTLFEADERVGGKMYTRIIDGVPVELGAVGMTRAYARTLPLMKRLGLAVEPFPYAFHLDIERRAVVKTPMSGTLLRQMWAFRTFLARDGRRRAKRPQGPIDPGLRQSFTAWAESMGFPRVADQLIPLVTSFGYGQLSEVPADYVLRYLHLRNFDALALGQFWRRFIPARLRWNAPFLLMSVVGMQRLPERLAEGLDVRLGARVTRIARDGEAYALTIGGSGATERFDTLIFATVPTGIDGLASVLPADLRSTIGAIRHRQYAAVLCRVDGVGFGTFYPDVAGGRVVSPGADRLVCISRARESSDCAVLYHLSDDFVAEEELVAMLHAGLADMHGKLVEIIEIKRWNYFPHFDSATLADDPFGVIESSQGVDEIYYVGSYIDFETVENTLESTMLVIDQHFDRSTNGTR